VARLNPAQTEALGKWWSTGLLQQAVREGFTATDTIAAASDLARQFGEGLTFAESQSIATLYGYAFRMERAASEFVSADLGDSIDAKHIGVPPWARDEQVMNTAPIWNATFRFDFIDQNGNAQSEYRTSVFEMTLPDTIGELVDAMHDDAEAMAEKYDVQLVGIQPIELLAV
jgi:hypothetical protein